MTLLLEDVFARLTKGEELGSLLLSLRSPSDVSVERGAALVRCFDQATFDVFRGSGGSGADFETFIKQPFVEAVPGVERCYRIRDDDRRTLLKDWVGGDDWRRLNADLAAFFQRRTPDGSADELVHLLALGSEREQDALRLFSKLFDAAETAFDLSLCAELLDVVGDPSHRLSESFLDAIKRRRCRLRARHMWSEEFFRTTPYHPRSALKSGLDGLMGDAQRWILQIYAGGGMGKTMFVRWAIARHLVPMGVPCARLDFDFEQPAWLTERPWQLVLKVARQLNEQMPDAPLTELIKEYGDAEAEEQQKVADAAQKIGRLRTYDERYNAEAFARFKWGLLETSSPAPVIVCDTLERVSLYHQQELLTLIDRFAEVRREYAGLRLLLAGRYDLRKDEHVSGFDARYGDQTSALEIVPFDGAESREYLTLRRGLPDDARVQAIIDRSEGVPFKLSLFATIVQDDRTLDEKAIREMPNVNVEYLIKRVVDQIREPMAQWVLRHGVIPRQLTRTFLRDVMLPHLVDIQRGSQALDSGLDALPDRLQNPDRFKRGVLTTDAVDLDTLWRTLNRYAADHSWISQSKDWPDTLVFHADVVDPMRGLLQEQPIFHRLHEDAIRYYEAKAAADAANWTRWTREAIYHYFQNGGDAAPAAWHAALEAAAARADPKARREIAAEILGSEYVDETGQPRLRHDDTPMVGPALLVAANYVAAQTGIEEARIRNAASSDQAWATAERRIRDAQRIQNTLPEPALPPGALALMQAALEIRRNPEAALQTLEAARKDVTPSTASEYEELYGDAIRTTDTPGAAQHYRAAVDALTGDGLATPRGRNVALKLADASVTMGDYERAVVVAEAVRAAAERVGDAVDMSTASAQLAGSLLAAGRLDAALDACAPPENPSLVIPEDRRVALDAFEVRAHLLAGDPLRAWGDAHRHFPRAFEEHADADPTFRDATGLIVKGRVHHALFEFEDAITAWRDARRAWDLLREPAMSLTCVFHVVRTLIRETQQLAVATQMMTEAERTATSLGLDARLTFRTLDAERLAATNRKSALGILDSVLDEPGLATTCEPEVGVAAAMQAMVLQHRVGDAAAVLTAVLGRVTPPVARLGLLQPRERAVTPDATVARALEPLVRPAVDILRREKRGVDAPVLDALEALRWIGASAEAHEWLPELHERLRTSASRFHLLALRAFADRVGVAMALQLDNPSLDRKFHREFQERPRVYGVFLLGEAERLIGRDGRPLPKSRLTALQRYLDAGKIPASLQARIAEVTRATPKRVQSRPRKDASSAPLAAPALEVALPASNAAVGTADAITIAFGGRDDVSVLTDRGRPPAERSINTLFVELTGDSLEKLTSIGVVAPVALCQRLASDASVGVAIARLLSDPELVVGLSAPADVRIETTHSMFGGIPWELARAQGEGPLLVNHEMVRCLYRSAPAEVSSRVLTATAQAALGDVLKKKMFADGLLGPATRQGLSTFQRARGLPETGVPDAATLTALAFARYELRAPRPRSVVILRRSLRAQRSQVRGAAVTGFDVEGLYARAGWRTTVLEDPTRGELKEAIVGAGADVVHVNVAVAENSRTGGLYLDVGRDIGGSGSGSIKISGDVQRAQGVPVADFVDSLRSPQQGASPIVVLDPPAVPSHTEGARQLVLRNAFASDVFQLGVVPAIVATGLLQGDEYWDVASALLKGFASGVPLRRACDAMRQVSRTTGQGPIRFPAATAFFSHYADFTPWPATPPGA